MARMFDQVLFRSGAGQELMSACEWTPLVDIDEDDQEYLITAELPGVKKEDVMISLENGVLYISGGRKHEEETMTRKPHRIERCYGRFVQNFTLPDDANAARISAEFKDGLLKVHIPKDVSTKLRIFEVKVG